MTVMRPLPDAGKGRLHGLPPLPAPRAAVPAPNATLVEHDEITATLAVFGVALDQPLADFRPGQYVSLGVVNGDQFVQRPYSIVAIDPERTRIELFVRRLPDGRLSNLLWPLELGARVRVGPARGLFTLQANDPRPRVMVGTGTGLAPLLAMLDDSAARGDTTPTVLIHGVSYHAELAYSARIEAWIAAAAALDYRPSVSRPHDKRNETWRGPTGRAEAQLARLMAEQPSLAAGVGYLCGNPDMIDACRAVLLGAGMATADVHVEQFHAPVLVGARDTGMVTRAVNRQ